MSSYWVGAVALSAALLLSAAGLFAPADAPAGGGDGQAPAQPLPRSEGNTIVPETDTERASGTVTDPATGQEYSDSVLLVTVDPEADPAAVLAVFEKYTLTVRYDYGSLAMYAVRTAEPLTLPELDALIAALTAEEGILGAEKDGVVHALGGAEGSALH